MDVLTRKWLAYIFDTAATAHTAIQSMLKAASPAGEIPNLRLRTDNDPQYGGHEFKKAMQMLGIRHEFIWKHASKQNGHVESFHGALKEYVWSHDCARFQNAEVVLAKAFVDCNEDRIHSALDYITPSKFVCKLKGGNK